MHKYCRKKAYNEMIELFDPKTSIPRLYNNREITEILVMAFINGEKQDKNYYSKAISLDDFLSED